ncbi:MAG: leucine-rich repeat domain-containing protein, partial [Synergistaceae bacterium]|nr:leucine-rich repeat domain-containing protein [Synergistaceae bacterium]
ITRNDSGDVTDIEGQYVSFDIRNGDDALDAVTVLREELGIRSPDKELNLALAHSHSTGSEYSFQQVHNGVKVFGRRAMVSANSEGKGNFLHSSLLSSDIVAKVDSKNDIGKSSAENIVKNEYADGIEIDSEATERIIYDFGDNEPFYAYIVRAYGVSGDEYVDESVFVNAETSEVMGSSSNIHNADAHGKNEISEEDLTFPVVQQDGKFIMYDPNLHVKLYESQMIVGRSEVKSDTNYFSDREQVSAYTNMLEIMQWWKDKDKFGRDSLDGNGGQVNVILNAYWPGKEDDAAWSDSLKSISVYNKVNRKYSAGADIGWLTHETQHGVMYYTVGSSLYMNGAIHEGYADIFACVKNKHWKFGDVLYKDSKLQDGTEINCLRNVADPFNINSLTGWALSNGQQKTTEIHVSGLLVVANAAYLMHEDNPAAQNGLTWDELGKVWYNSMFKGLWSSMWDSDTHSSEGGLFSHVTYDDVRRCVVNAAKELVANGELEQSKIAAIEQAFNTIGNNISNTYTVSTTSANLSGKVTNKATGAALSGVKVTVYKAATSSTASATLRAAGNSRSLQGSLVSRLIQAVKTFLTEYFSINLKQGTYSVTFSKEGYHPYTAEVSIGNADVELNVALSADVVVGVDVPIDEAHFPDPTFRGYVMLFDTNSDGILSHQEIEGVTYIDFGNTTYSVRYPVGSLKGIEHFIYLTYLNCTGTITIDNELDLSRNTALETLYCAGNNLVSLNVSSCSALQFLQCGINALTSLDISNCTALQYLECEYNNLTELDVRNNTALLSLNCWVNGLTSLDVSQNTVLQILNCGGNQLTQLDVRNCVALVWLECQYNSLKKINASGCSNLERLYCQAQYENSLELLDISGCAALSDFLYNSNESLKILNMSGCISLTRLDFSNQYYTDPKFQLVSLDVSGCIGLTELICYNNQLVSLNVNGCTALQTLACQDNQLTELDVSGCTALQSLSCENNQLTTLDLSNCPELNSGNVYCDSSVTVIWPSSTTSAASTFSASSSGSRTASYAPGVLAVLPAFTPPVSGTYTFTVSLDSTPSEGSTLLLLAD